MRSSQFGSAAWQKERRNISDRGVTLLADAPHRLPLERRSRRARCCGFYADPEPYPGEDLEREFAFAIPIP